MPYRAEISRTNPSCFLFLVDQSGSMREALASADAEMTKAQGVADAINTLLQNVVSKCTKSDGIRDYYHVGVIGYSGAGVGSALQGSLTKHDLVPIGVLGNAPARIEKRIKRVSDGKGGFLERPYNYPVWFEPSCGGGTPMNAALDSACKVLKPWLLEHPNCFPPIVINISDGESTDGSPHESAQRLMSLANNDGNVLLFNVHLSSYSQKAVAYPDNTDDLEDEFAKELFKMSSVLTSYMRKFLADEGYEITDNSRGLVVHADLSVLIRFLDIGTRPADLR